MDKELASGEYFLKERERAARKKEQRKVRQIFICLMPSACSKYGHQNINRKLSMFWNCAEAVQNNENAKLAWTP